MTCPSCGYAKSGVANTRAIAGGAAIRRRRECARCHRRFTTREAYEDGRRYVPGALADAAGAARAAAKALDRAAAIAALLETPTEIEDPPASG